MPVTIKTARHEATTFNNNKIVLAQSADMLLHLTTSDDSFQAQGALANPREIVQSSFDGLRPADSVYATKNGMVHACLEAYNTHHNLVLRPDDVWVAILTQFSLYVNKHSEELRGQFVSHDGQMGLHIEVELDGLDHGKTAVLMTKLMQDNIKDEGLQQWIQPAFTTTTKVDQAVCSVIFMGSMQKYFTYSWGTRCGIPNVTLLGEAGDWAKIRSRAERLASYGKEPATWLALLRPTLDMFVTTFMEPQSSKVAKFWQHICNQHKPNGSGTTTYSGWITSFCFWDESGALLHGSQPGNARLARNQIPNGFTKVPVLLVNNGIEMPSEMIAGSVAFTATYGNGEEKNKKQGPFGSSGRAGLDTLQPTLGWYLYKK